MDRSAVWLARVAWLLLPVTVGAAVAQAGSGTSTAVHAAMTEETRNTKIMYRVFRGNMGASGGLARSAMRIELF